jgi:diguanylate cyclase (GGDEF)-like protein
MRKLWLSWIALWIGAHAFALDANRPVTAFNQQAWYSDDGLPHNTIHAIAQSQNGYLWLGSWNGVTRFNGRDFVNFDSSQALPRTTGGIRALVVMPNDEIYATTTLGGLLHYVKGEWRAIELGNYKELYGLALGPDGRLWIGTQGKGFLWWDPKTQRVTQANYPEVAESWVQRFIFDGPRVWLATARGLFLFENDTLKRMGEPQGLGVKTSFYDGLRDKTGTLWIAAETGLYRLAQGPQISFEKTLLLSDGSDAGAVQSLLEDSTGSLWVGTQSHGLFRMPLADTKGARRIDPALTIDQGLSNNRITALFEDQERNVWVGTNSGLNRLNDTPFQRITRREGLRDEFVRTVARARAASGEWDAERMWIGTSRGLHLSMGGGATSVGDPLASSASITSVLHASDGSVYAGTYDQGLLVRSPQASNFVRLDRSNSQLPTNQVRSLMEDDKRRIWIGTAQGALVIDGAGRRVLAGAAALSSDYVLSLHQGKDGSIWLGSSRGVSRYENFGEANENITLFSTPDRFPNQNAFDIFEDSERHIWVATSRGLAYFDGERFKAINSEERGDIAVFSGYFDSIGGVWLTGNSGLLRVPQSELEMAKKGTPVLLRSNSKAQLFRRDEGMSAAQINGTSDPALAIDANGKIWLPTARGVSVVDPKLYQLSAARDLPVVLEEVLVNRQTINPLASTVLHDSGRHRYEFHFVSMSFSASARPLYRYRLQGFDDEYSTPTREPRAAYTNLPPGNYRFEVQASTGDVWAQTTGIDLQIRARFFERPWFWPAVGIASLLLVATFIRTLQMRERSRRATLEGEVERQTQVLSLRNKALEELDRQRAELLQTVQSQAEAFAQQAREDSLTGLPNRRYFQSQISDAFASARERRRNLVVGLIDLDLFKQVNDQYGHQQGDELLVAFSALARKHFAQHGLVCRYGGEEFAFFFERMSLFEAIRHCEALRELCESTRLCPELDLLVTITVGVTDAPEATSFEKALAKADQYLYAGKANGRNQVVSGL